MLKQARVYIKGDVVGVGFRAWTKIQAKTNNVSGWVRNVYNDPYVFGPSGGIEALFQGEENRVNKMVKLVKTGPPVARVEDVEVFSEKPAEIHEGFEIRK
jgi:acylphosphatase